MRNAFAQEITKLAAQNENLVLLAGDIGNRLFDDFKEKNPARFYNCGIAEALMTSVASGLANNSFLPVTYTITPFNTLRCLEQIKLDVCYPNLPVTIVGTGSGLSYASLGATHHSLDDIAAMRMLPNMQILAPGDIYEVIGCLRAAIDSKKPTYIRLGKKGEPVIHSKEFTYEIGKVIPVHKGQKNLVISVGNMLSECDQAVKKFEAKYNFLPELVSIGSVNPLDEEYLKNSFEKFEKIIVAEEHGFTGGAGAAILEWAYTNNQSVRKLKLINTPKEFIIGAGNQTYARKQLHLDEDSIFAIMEE